MLSKMVLSVFQRLATSFSRRRRIGGSCSISIHCIRGKPSARDRSDDLTSRLKQSVCVKNWC